MIEVRRTSDRDPLRFEVVVREGADATRHRVTMSLSGFDAFAARSHSPEQCVEAAFRFLLDREPKEAILKSFDVSVIARYFPEFHREFPNYLDPL
jgi:hypothetical protein